MGAKVTIRVYLKYGGGVFEYDVSGKDAASVGRKAREHCGKIMAEGYRHSDGVAEFEWFAPHWIDKIKVIGQVPTAYIDRPSGT